MNDSRKEVSNGARVYIAGDHAGFELKARLAAHLTGLGYSVTDMGPSVLDGADDYPDFVTPLAKKVATENALGIVIAGSGQGEAMCANRILGIRAMVFYGGSLAVVRVAREHNDANVLSLGARFVSEGEAEEAARLFLETPFPGDERHRRRLAKF